MKRQPSFEFDALMALRHTRGLQRLHDEALEPLARELRLARYAHGTTFFRRLEEYRRAPLRVVVQGQLFWTAFAGVDPAGAPTLDAGAVFGLASVNEWASKHPAARRFAVPENPGFVAEAHEELWVLELPREAYHRAFAPPQSKRLVSRLIGLYGARPDSPKFIRALRRTPEFSRACPMHVARLVEGGVLERWPPGWTIPVNGSRAQTALRYVVTGKVRIIDEDTGQSTIVGAGELIPEHSIFSDRGPTRSLIAISEHTTEVIRIRRDSVDFTIRTTPGFARTLGPATLGSWIREPSGLDHCYPIIAAGEMTLVLADPATEALPVSGLVSLLAEAAHDHLDDRVAVVRLLREGPGIVARSSPFGVPEALLVPRGPEFAAAVRALLVDLAERWGLLFDHILVDAGSLALDASERLTLMRAMVDLPCPSQIAYLVASPDDWASMPERVGLLSGVSVLPTALLGPKPPNLELERVGEWLRELGDGGGGRPPGRPRPGRVRGLAAHAGHVLAQLMGVPGSDPTPWPLDAIRMRLDAQTLEVLRARDNPRTIDCLALSVAQADQLRACMERWARAVTWRRIGVGIGGAGCQSYVAIPFIRRLREVGIPIDVFSGSSTGAFISAFYSALGDRGLDELVSKRHHFGFGVAFAWTDNTPFELLLTYLLDGLDLNDLELPVIAVAARAADGETAYLSSSLAGQACMASGSLPPMVPTYVQNRRLLDGGLTLDVPTAVLTSAGAELIVGVQPIPRVNPRPLMPRGLLIPPGLRKLASINTPQRALDYYRAYLMLFRQAARGDEPNADVVYEATTRSSHASLFFQAKRVAEEAEGSPALERAVEDTVAEWRRMLLRPPGRVILDPESGKFLLGNSSAIALEGRRSAECEWIPPHSRAIVHQIAEFVARHSHIDLRACLCVPENESDEKIARWLDLLDETLRGEDCLERRRFERSVVRDPSLSRVQLELGVIPRFAEGVRAELSVRAQDASRDDPRGPRSGSGGEPAR